MFIDNYSGCIFEKELYLILPLNTKTRRNAPTTDSIYIASSLVGKTINEVNQTYYYKLVCIDKHMFRFPRNLK